MQCCQVAHCLCVFSDTLHTQLKDKPISVKSFRVVAESLFAAQDLFAFGYHEFHWDSVT